MSSIVTPNFQTRFNKSHQDNDMHASNKAHKQIERGLKKYFHKILQPTDGVTKKVVRVTNLFFKWDMVGNSGVYDSGKLVYIKIKPKKRMA